VGRNEYGSNRSIKARDQHSYHSWLMDDIWNHQNRCIFKKEAPNLTRALVMAREERKLWVLAGAKGLNFQTAPLLNH
jgi:hypothetical protein